MHKASNYLSAASIINICDRVRIKGPLVGNKKNEIIKFYVKKLL